MGSLRARLLALDALKFVLVSTIAGLGIWAASALVSLMHEQSAMQTALRNQLEADMMHDALRSDVLAALLSAARGERDAQAEIEADLAEHGATFQKSFAANRAAELPPAVQQALAAVEAPLAAYLAQARAVTLAAFSAPDEAQGQLDEFTARFKQLEGAMSDVTDRIEAANDALTQSGEALAGLVQPLLLGAALLALLICAGAVLHVARAVVRPLAEMTEAMGRLAAGALDVAVPAQARRDEIGAMAAAVQVFKDNAIERIRLEQAQDAERRAKERRIETVARLVADFEAEISAIARGLASAAVELQATAQTLTGSAERGAARAGSVAAASEEASANVQTVATAAEEMSASVAEIIQQVGRSRDVAHQAAQEAERTDGTVQGLVGGAQKIGEVIQLISSIASQTNLLALNATIEAARAGEAGRGFAVVANEVKALADQTTKATSDIAEQVQAIQGVSNEAASAIRGIGGVVAQMNEIASAIASAVEQQGAATQEVARNVQEAARGSQEVSENIVEVERAARETGGAAAQVLDASGALARQSEDLKSRVSQFIEGIRAA